MNSRHLARGAAALTLLWATTPVLAAPDGYATEAASIVERAYPAGKPGAAAIVTEKGKVVWAGGSGMADIAASRPIDADTVFRLGSITKQFTAAVVLQLVAEGKVSLDDPLTRFLPDYPADKGGKATVRQLLNHTSGIQSYTGIPGWMVEAKTANAYTTDELIAQFRDMPVEFQPGEKWNYNNSGYVLLGAVIEKVTGRPWYAEVERRIAKPLGLKSIRYGGEEAKVPAFAIGYRAGENGAFEPAQKLDMSVPHAAGALIGNVRDLAKWSQALHHGKVVTPALYAEMIAPTALPGGESAPYGYGMGRGGLHDLTMLTHNGGIFGFATNAMYVPERDLFVAVFTNADSGIASNGVAMLRLAAAAIGKPFPTFTEAPVDTAAVEPFLGSYRIDGTGATRAFFLREGKLYTRREGASDSPVLPAGGGRFFYGPDSLNWFELVREADGTRTMLMHQNGATEGERAVRTGDLPPEAATVKVARDVLAAHVGEYVTAFAPIVVAVGGDGALNLKLGDQQPVPLRALSDSEFAAVGVDAKVVFQRDGARSVGLVIHQGGRQIVASRKDDAATVD